MKKTSLILIACLATVLSACEYHGIKTDEIEGEEDSIATPSASKKPESKKPEDKKPGDKKPDEVVVPEKPKAPEAKKPTEPKKPDGEKKPPVVEKPVSIGPIITEIREDLIPATPPKPEEEGKIIKMTDVRTALNGWHACKNCGGSGGKVDEYLCPRDYVVTGYDLGTADFDGHTIVGKLRIVCARPTPLNIDPKQIEYATDSEGNIYAGEGSFADFRTDRCGEYSGVAAGVFGRGGARLDSMGFFCDAYSPSKTAITVYRGDAKKTTYQKTDSEFGGAPGVGGSPFSLHCPEGEVIIGVGIRRGKDVDAIDGIYCASLEPIFMRALFETDK